VPLILPDPNFGVNLINCQKGGDLMSEKDARGAPVPSQRPRSPRVPVEFALEVEGKTLTGEAFNVRAQAIKISRGGATIILDAEVGVGEIVKLTPPFGRGLDAEVNGAWTDQIDGRRRIGVKLLDEDGWFAE
jgi:PilZ domain-containing protein